MHQYCRVIVHAEDTYVLAMLDGPICGWSKQNFKNTKGVDLASEWKEIWEIMKGQKIEGVKGIHDYEILLGGMMECLKNSESSTVMKK